MEAVTGIFLHDYIITPGLFKENAIGIFFEQANAHFLLAAKLLKCEENFS